MDLSGGQLIPTDEPRRDAKWFDGGERVLKALGELVPRRALSCRTAGTVWRAKAEGAVERRELKEGMTSEASEFVLRYDEPDGERSIVLEDHGRDAYAYLLEGGAVAGDVWLYNAGDDLEAVDWRDRSAMPFRNPARYCTGEAVPRLRADSEIDCSWSEQGVTVDSAGRLQGVSVNTGQTLEAASAGIPNGQVGATTAGEIRAAGGQVVSSPTAKNPNHATMSGITPQQAEQLFTPTVPNPSKGR